MTSKHKRRLIDHYVRSFREHLEEYEDALSRAEDEEEFASFLDDIVSDMEHESERIDDLADRLRKVSL